MIEIALTILCICNSLMVGLISIFIVNNFIPQRNNNHKLQPTPPSFSEEPKIDESAQRKFQAEMDAFQELMNYNQDKAYGIEPKE